MNLRNSPNQKELAKMLSLCDDAHNHYFIAVDNEENVSIEEYSNFPLTSKNKFQFFFGIFPYRKGYVGPTAAKNRLWVKRLFDDIIYCWAKGITGEVDNR